MGSWGAEDEIEAMKGRKLASVVLAPDKSSITFNFQDGHTQSLSVEGDCCSRSWIEHLEVPGNIEGATLTGFEEFSMNKTDDDAYNPKTSDSEYYPREHECLKVYQSKFQTDRGDIVLEYRNSSNGYYGGYLVA